MALSLVPPSSSPADPVPPRYSQYRYWDEINSTALRVVNATVARVLADRDRQGDLFAPPVLEAATPAAVNAIAATTKNETLGGMLSPSQANLFLNCSAKWWFKHGLSLPDPKGGRQVRGLAAHKVVEHWYKLQLQGEVVEVDSLEEVYEAAWEFQSAGAQFSNDDDIEDLKRSGARLLRKYLDEVAPSIKPAKVEQHVTGSIAGVPVQGFIDLVDVDGRIIDCKFAEKSPSGITPDYAFQLATYRQLQPGANGKARLDTLVNNKTPKLVTIEYEVSVADQLLTQNLYPRVREGIREGLYFPNRGSNMCSRKYCNFCDACEKEFGGKVE